MHASSRRRMADASGFTLIELLVVMIIISILMAVAIPVFLGQKQKALGSNAKGLVKSVQSTVESCGAATTTGAFTSEDGATVVCNAQYVMDDEKGIAGKACNGTGATFNSGSVPECWALINSTTTPNDTYLIVAKTSNVKGNEYGWFALRRNSEGVVKTCGYSTGTVPSSADTALTPNQAPDANGRRLCANGNW